MRRPRKPDTCLAADPVLNADYERIAERDRRRLAEIELLQREHEAMVAAKQRNEHTHADVLARRIGG